MPTTEDRKKGSLFGLAWGDVFGCPVEGWRHSEIAAVYGKYDALPATYPFATIARRKGIKQLRRLRPLGLHSDDTQQALGLVHVCLNLGSWCLYDWTRLLVSGMETSAWRGIGRNFATAVRALMKGTSPQRSGSRSAGIGAAMRIAPLGAIFAGDRRRLAEAVMESSLTTHADIRAGSIAYAIACAVSCLIEEWELADIRNRLWQAVAQVEREWLQGTGWSIDVSGGHQVSTALKAMFDNAPRDPAAIRARVSELARPHLAAGSSAAHPNQGFSLLGGLHAIAMALCLDAEPQDVLAEIVRQGYDTDTVAAIAGGLLGARFGVRWIPIDRLTDEQRLARYAEAIAANAKPPERHSDFLRHEAKLTRSEHLFQAGVCRRWAR